MYVVGAFVALQVADLGFPGLEIPESAIRYVWIGAVFGFPLVLVFGWRYDIVDGQVLRTATDPGDPGLPLERRDHLTLTVMGVALALMFTGLGYKIVETRDVSPVRAVLADAAPNSLAVLPFRNFGGIEGNEYLTDGITETLLHALAQTSDLKVTARTSSFHYKDQDVDIRDIAAALGVSKVLEGSVQQSGDKIRVVAQLIEADTGFHLWSATYDKDLGEIFAIQDSIATEVAFAILATITAAPGIYEGRLTAVSTTNLQAYQKYLQGLEQARIQTSVSMPKAEALFLQALAIDPDFIEATYELAYLVINMTQNGTIPVEVGKERLAPLRDKLLSEHPDETVTVSVDGYFSVWSGTFDAEDIINRMISAIERNSNDIRAYRDLAITLRLSGQTDAAIEWLRRALSIDPLDHELLWELGNNYGSVGDTKREIEAYERVTEVNPLWASGHAYLANAVYRDGDYVRWYQHTRQAAALDPLDSDYEDNLARGLLFLGLNEESREHVARIKSIRGDERGEWDVSSLLAAQEDPASARAMTEAFLRLEPTGRNYSHQVPAVVYVSASVEQGRAAEAIAVLEDILPGVTAVDFSAASGAEFLVQFFATIAWAVDKSPAEIAARLDAVKPSWDETVPGWDTNRLYSVPVSFLRGDMEEAARISIEFLSSAWAMPFVYRHIYPYNIVAAQPEVAAELIAIEADLREGGAAVRAYIEQEKADGIEH